MKNKWWRIFITFCGKENSLPTCVQHLHIWKLDGNISEISRNMFNFNILSLRMSEMTIFIFRFILKCLVTILSAYARSHVRFVRNPHGLLHFWLVTFQQEWVTWSALRCGASGESGRKVAAAPLSKTAAAAASAKTWFVKHPLDYMLHNRFLWKRSGRRSSMWPPYSLRRNLSAAVAKKIKVMILFKATVTWAACGCGQISPQRVGWSHGAAATAPCPGKSIV